LQYFENQYRKDIFDTIQKYPLMDKKLLIIGSNGYVSALDAHTGEELWRTMLREGFLGGSGGKDVSVLIDGDRIYAGCAGRVYALKASNGEILWSNDLKKMGYNEVALALPGIHTQFITRVERRDD
jgi:outer membrane protein assembly factor BamB